MSTVLFALHSVDLALIPCAINDPLKIKPGAQSVVAPKKQSKNNNVVCPGKNERLNFKFNNIIVNYKSHHLPVLTASKTQHYILNQLYAISSLLSHQKKPKINYYTFHFFFVSFPFFLTTLKTLSLNILFQVAQSVKVRQIVAIQITFSYLLCNTWTFFPLKSSS